MIKVGMFCTINSERYSRYDLHKGDTIYVAGDMMVVPDESKPYDYKKLFIAAFTEDGHVLGSKRPLTVDATNLAPVKEVVQQALKDMMENDFKGA